jgi:hypothetical protein
MPVQSRECAHRRRPVGGPRSMQGGFASVRPPVFSPAACRSAGHRRANPGETQPGLPPLRFGRGDSLKTGDGRQALSWLGPRICPATTIALEAQRCVWLVSSQPSPRSRRAQDSCGGLVVSQAALDRSASDQPYTGARAHEAMPVVGSGLLLPLTSLSRCVTCHLTRFPHFTEWESSGQRDSQKIRKTCE